IGAPRERRGLAALTSSLDAIAAAAGDRRPLPCLRSSRPCSKCRAVQSRRDSAPFTLRLVILTVSNQCTPRVRIARSMRSRNFSSIATSRSRVHPPSRIFFARTPFLRDQLRRPLGALGAAGERHIRITYLGINQPHRSYADVGQNFNLAVRRAPVLNAPR